MREAIKQAQKAFERDEVPVGAVIVYKDKIIARGYNQKEKKNDATLHAEIIALKKAYKKLGTWRLNDCDMYVTLEPCAMCAGAIIQSRMHKLVFGAYDLKGGCVTSKFNLFEKDKFNHNVDIEEGCMERECSNILKSFFAGKR